MGVETELMTGFGELAPNGVPSNEGKKWVLK